MDGLKEVIDFLGHPRQEVRKMAIDSLAGISLDEGVIIGFVCHPEYLSKVSTLLKDEPIIALSAWKVLINLSKDPRISANLYGQVIIIIDTICDNSSPFGDFASMLLSNMAHEEDCQLEICKYLPKLLPIFIESRSFNSKANYDLLANVFAHLTTCKEGRKYFLSNNFEALFKIAGQTISGSVMRRGGCFSTIKNCFFETACHKDILDADDEEDRLFAYLLGKLASPQSVFDEEDLEEMILDIQLEYRYSPAEEDLAIRSLILESLILIGTTRYGREKMREKKIYSILREWHKQEPEEILNELVEKVVELIIRDENDQE